MAFHIKAQALRKAQLEPNVALQVLDERLSIAEATAEPAGRNRVRWRQADVQRALVAAEKAGLTSYRVEIAVDGTISIVVGDPADTDPKPDTLRDAATP